jgi:hypothetical protein
VNADRPVNEFGGQEHLMLEGEVMVVKAQRKAGRRTAAVEQPFILGFVRIRALQDAELVGRPRIGSCPGS